MTLFLCVPVNSSPQGVAGYMGKELALEIIGLVPIFLT